MAFVASLGAMTPVAGIGRRPVPRLRAPNCRARGIRRRRGQLPQRQQRRRRRRDGGALGRLRNAAQDSVNSPPSSSSSSSSSSPPHSLKDVIVERLEREFRCGQVTRVLDVSGAHAPGARTRHVRYDTREGSFLAKVNLRRAEPDAFAGEAASLRALQRAAVGLPLRVPTPICYGALPLRGSYLLLEYIDMIPFGASMDAVQRKLGEGMAALHARRGFRSHGHRRHRRNRRGCLPQQRRNRDIDDDDDDDYADVGVGVTDALGDTTLGEVMFGFPTTTWLGASTPQDNTPRTSWADFFVEQRLRPQLRRAWRRYAEYGVDNADALALGRLGERLLGTRDTARDDTAHVHTGDDDGDAGVANARDDLRARRGASRGEAERRRRRIPAGAGEEGAARRILSSVPDVRPALLHGDLMLANIGATPARTPVLMKPASYYGHAEADLALSDLFGGFPPAFWEAYRANVAAPPSITTAAAAADGDDGGGVAAADVDCRAWTARDARYQLYQLYYMLVQLNTSGAGIGRGGDAVNPRGWYERVVAVLRDLCEYDSVGE